MVSEFIGHESEVSTLKQERYFTRVGETFSRPVSDAFPGELLRRDLQMEQQEYRRVPASVLQAQIDAAVKAAAPGEFVVIKGEAGVIYEGTITLPARRIGLSDVVMDPRA